MIVKALSMEIWDQRLRNVIKVIKHTIVAFGNINENTKLYENVNGLN